LLALLVAGAVHAGGPEPTPLALGSEIPMADKPMTSVDDSQVTLGEIKGEKGTLVVFTCNACPWARAWQGRIAAIGNDARKQGFGVVAINSNAPEIVPDDGFPQMKDRAKELALAFPYVVDDTQDVARAFGASRTPEVFLFDAGGHLAYHGTVDDNAKDEASVSERWLANAVAAVAAGRAVDPAETKALGCSIKWRP